MPRQACLNCLTFFAAVGANDWLPVWLPSFPPSQGKW